MSRLSPAVKALINASHANPHVRPAPSQISQTFREIGLSAGVSGVTRKEWVSIAAAAAVTMNSPNSLLTLWAAIPIISKQSLQQDDTNSSSEEQQSIIDAEIIREVGLKSIAFNGIPKTINTLTAFHAALPREVSSKLNTTPLRGGISLNESASQRSESLETLRSRGLALWNSVYGSLSDKLTRKLGTAHPDMPGVIISTDYGALLADPPSPPNGQNSSKPPPWAMDRWHTSLIAVACLRAQGGAGPQVLSHVFGLRNAAEEVRKGELMIEGGRDERAVEGRLWLATDDGVVWLLESVDRIVEGFRGEKGVGKRDSKL